MQLPVPVLNLQSNTDTDNDTKIDVMIKVHSWLLLNLFQTRVTRPFSNPGCVRAKTRVW